jgi:four helix bundle protein
MGLVRRFEDRTAWREARELARGVYAVAGQAACERDWGLRDRIRRAAVSAMNHTAEGFDSGSRVEVGRFLRYAARSASEVQSCLHIALDQGYLDGEPLRTLYGRAERVRSLLRGLRRALDRRGRSGAGGGEVVRDGEALWRVRLAGGSEGQFIVTG